MDVKGLVILNIHLENSIDLNSIDLETLADIFAEAIKEELGSPPNFDASEGWIKLYELSTYDITIYRGRVSIWCVSEVLPKILDVLKSVLEKIKEGDEP